jgi:phosphoribosylanthranilate isomerase
MTRIKVCGITTLDDARMAIELGADAIGFIFAHSQRRVEPDQARTIVRQITPFVTTVGVFMDEELAEVKHIASRTGIDVVQLHGHEPPSHCDALDIRVIKRIEVSDETTTESLLAAMNNYSVSAFLLDPGCGSGHIFDWKIACGISVPIIVAGGLDPSNVGSVVQMLHPYGVDVSSGVEYAPGRKQREKVKSFIAEVRRCSLPVS